MVDQLRLTILGCGSSPGVPRICGNWGNCDPTNLKNRRTRTSLMIERLNGDGEVTRVIVDTGPDFRQQMLAARVDKIDGVVYTHAHADHIHGIDDLRGYFLKQKKLVDIWSDDATYERLYEAFDYCFKTPSGSNYPPILNRHAIQHYHKFSVNGAGGPIEFEALPHSHGSIHSLSFRVGNFAYCTDVSHFPEKTAQRLHGLDALVLGTLQYKRHPNHFSLDQSLEWIKRLAPNRAYLTHMHIPLDYDNIMNETPENIYPSYDGLVFHSHYLP